MKNVVSKFYVLPKIPYVSFTGILTESIGNTLYCIYNITITSLSAVKMLNL